MTSEALLRIIAAGKGEGVAFQSGNAAPEAVARTIGAFLNSRGGRVILGVDPPGQTVGIEDTEEVVRSLETELPKLISPRALWTIQRVAIDDAELAVVEVPEGVDKPYVVGGAIYLRLGGSTGPASLHEITRLIRRGAEAAPRWERQIALGAERADLDDELVAKTAAMAIESGRWQGDVDRIDVDGFLHANGHTRWID